jgi:signal transduction histidine kinase/putative methionine-R-sulfoxide reductase with GAF domain
MREMLVTAVGADRPLEPLGRTQRLARLYLVLSRTNRAIERAADDEALLGAACQTIIEVGGFLMSWVGLIDRQTRRVVPVACFGHDAGYLDFVQIQIEGVRSEGPTGQAIRQERTIVCDDIASDSRMEPWREQALLRGYRSSVGLPLYKRGVLCGVLTVYADLPGRFDDAEIELLEELARDVSFGLATIEEVQERRRAQQELVESERRFRATVETLLDPFVILSAVRDQAGRIVDFVYEFANEAACIANRTSREDLLGRPLLGLLPAHESSGLIALYAHTVESGEPLILDDLDYVDSWGGERLEKVFEVRASKLGDGLAYTWRDVTERRQAVRRRAEELEQRVRERTSELDIARRRAIELGALSTAMLEIDEPIGVGRRLLESARLAGAVDGIVGLADGNTDDLTVLASFGMDEASVARIAASPALSRTLIREAAQSGVPLVIENVSEFRRRFGQLESVVGERHDRARVAIALRKGDKTFGGLALGFEPRSFGTEDLAFLMSLANSAALALERLGSAQAERDARGMLEAVVAQMPVGVTVVSRDGGILYRNRALDSILRGIDPALTSATRADGSACIPDGIPAARSLATGEVVVAEEMAVVRDDGTSAVISQTSAPIYVATGEVAGAVVVTLDETERRELEQVRDAFLGVLSHELRTPVTTIYGSAKLMVARGERMAPAARQDLAGDIVAEAERLARMVDDLLVLARAERGADMTVRDAALVQHRLRGVSSILAAAWPERSFTCEIPEHVPPVVGDEAYLEHVFLNLLGNAAKYGRHEIVARVRVGPDVVEVSVLDDGPGVEPAEQDRIFELFARAKSTSSLPGAGIGLFAARRLVEAMGGRLTIANRAEGGAEFTATLLQYRDPDEFDLDEPEEAEGPAPE